MRSIAEKMTKGKTASASHYFKQNPDFDFDKVIFVIQKKHYYTIIIM